MEEKRYSDIDKIDESKTEKFKIQKEAMLKVSLMDIKWNKDRKNSFCERYEKESKSSS